jgi:hypothetical protein
MRLTLHQSFIQRGGGGDGGIYRHEFDIGGYPPYQLKFFGKNISGFENLITLKNLTLSVILRHLEAEF